ncbi:TetR/AcrR family transcriptional regulator [Arthrobacter sp. H20]|uniref:TetR/AcrR family transcriptional regulator n=1 Tax=Arthrobacter sp. H20 TaxID=1267981 RepID=UPI0012DE00AE|nr:TetR/AcrR family transcriptional regulator [Arthrobacter sp. H20]
MNNSAVVTGTATSSEMTDTVVAPGRREQNKLDTRRAIAASALDLARAHGLGNFTADQVAAEAGVSRRTFFNYFHSAEEALTTTTDALLELAAAEFMARPADEPLLDAMIAALAAIAKTDNLSVCGELFRMAEGSPELMRSQLHAWERAEARIGQAVSERMGGNLNPLYLLALVGAVLSCVKAAMQVWAAAAENPQDGSAAELEDQIVGALSMLRDGFNNPR